MNLSGLFRFKLFCVGPERVRRGKEQKGGAGNEVRGRGKKNGIVTNSKRRGVDSRKRSSVRNNLASD